MRNSLFKQPVLLLKLVASVAYISMGALVAVNPAFFQSLYGNIPMNYVKSFALLLLVYGLYRLYRVTTEIKNLNKPDQNEEA